MLKIGKLYKIRLELMAKFSTKEPSWKVKEVKMQDLNTKTSLKFMFNRWLSTSEDDWDIMRELPAVRPGEDILPGKCSAVFLQWIPFGCMSPLPREISFICKYLSLL